jgi:hypothetical protein
MVVLRCTRKLLPRVDGGSPNSGEPPKSTTRLGDWYANIVGAVGRRHIVLGVSGVTLLPVLVPAAPYKTMLPRFAEATGQVLRALKIEEAKVVAEVNAMRDMVVATTNDRRVLGSMNDFVFMLDGYVEDHSLQGVALKLAESPCSPLKMKSPRQATLALFATRTLHLVRGVVDQKV